MTKFEDEIILTPVVSGITVSVISSVVTAPSVGMAVVSIVPGFGAGIGISISGSFDNMLRFWLLFFGRSLPPVSVRVSVVSTVSIAPVSVGMSVVSIVPRFGAGISISGGSSSGSGCSFGITFPVSVGVSVISPPSVVSTVLGWHQHRRREQQRQWVQLRHHVSSICRGIRNIHPIRSIHGKQDIHSIHSNRTLGWLRPQALP